MEEISSREFDAAVASGVAVVDFSAAWCGPCKLMGPVLENEVAPVIAPAKIFKVDIDANVMLAARFGIQSIPAMLVFKDGEKVAEFIGVTSADEIISAVKKVL
jgi:thioredoxin 1